MGDIGAALFDANLEEIYKPTQETTTITYADGSTQTIETDLSTGAKRITITDGKTKSTTTISSTSTGVTKDSDGTFSEGLTITANETTVTTPPEISFGSAENSGNGTWLGWNENNAWNAVVSGNRSEFNGIGAIAQAFAHAGCDTMIYGTGGAVGWLVTGTPAGAIAFSIAAGHAGEGIHRRCLKAGPSSEFK